MNIDRTLTVIIAKAEDLPGVWTAECLELGIVTQGTSIEDARRMAVEAIDLTIDDDLAHGLDPFERGVAPDLIARIQVRRP